MDKSFAVPGSCGEIVQGTVDGKNLHITCPINMFSCAIAKELKTSGSDIKIRKSDLSKIAGETSSKYCRPNRNENRNNSTYTIEVDGNTDKVINAVESFRSKQGISTGIAVDIRSELPVGKGMASSTADIAASLYAAAKAYGMETTVSEIVSTAISIEPTDGVLFDGIVLFDHISGDKLEVIGGSPPVEIIILEPKRTLDTVLFNKSKQSNGLSEYEMLVKEALEMAKEGVSLVDLGLIGQAASLSARLNQQVLFKPELEDIIDLSARKGALGVNIAHSGTVIGIIVESGYAKRVFERIYHYVPGDWYAYIVSMVDGGVRSMDEEIGRLC